jgi:hypothetical protein
MTKRSQAHRGPTSRALPTDLLSSVDALRASGLSAESFVTIVRSRELEPVELPNGERAFRASDIEALRSTA